MACVLGVAGELPWRVALEVAGGRRFIPLFDAGEYFAAWGAAVGRETVEGLDPGEGRVHLCHGAIPWILDVCREAYDAAAVVAAAGHGSGANLAVVDVEALADWWGFAASQEIHGEGRGVSAFRQEYVAFLNVIGNGVASSSGLLLQTSTLYAPDLWGECWWTAFELACEAGGWSVDGDEGDGSQGWLVHESAERCDQCGRLVDGYDVRELVDGLCSECAEVDQRAAWSRGYGDPGVSWAGEGGRGE